MNNILWQSDNWLKFFIYSHQIPENVEQLTMSSQPMSITNLSKYEAQELVSFRKPIRTSLPILLPPNTVDIIILDESRAIHTVDEIIRKVEFSAYITNSRLKNLPVIITYCKHIDPETLKYGMRFKITGFLHGHFRNHDSVSVTHYTIEPTSLTLQRSTKNTSALKDFDNESLIRHLTAMAQLKTLMGTKHPLLNAPIPHNIIILTDIKISVKVEHNDRYNKYHCRSYHCILQEGQFEGLNIILVLGSSFRNIFFMFDVVFIVSGYIQLCYTDEDYPSYVAYAMLRPTDIKSLFKQNGI